MRYDYLSSFTIIMRCHLIDCKGGAIHVVKRSQVILIALNHSLAASNKRTQKTHWH